MAAEVGLNPHTINLSLGIHGGTEALPPAEIRQFTTMCGHAMIAPHLVEDALPPGIPALARVFPVLGSVPAIAALGQVPMSQDLEGLRKRAFVALRRLLSNLARYRTLVVYIDDLQWGDLDSADLMAEILLPDDRPPMLLLLAYRSEYLDRSPALAAINALDEKVRAAVPSLAHRQL